MILNPRTGRLVKRDGKIGKSLLAANAAAENAVAHPENSVKRIVYPIRFIYIHPKKKVTSTKGKIVGQMLKTLEDVLASVRTQDMINHVTELTGNNTVTDIQVVYTKGNVVVCVNSTDETLANLSTIAWAMGKWTYPSFVFKNVTYSMHMNGQFKIE